MNFLYFWFVHVFWSLYDLFTIFHFFSDYCQRLEVLQFYALKHWRIKFSPGNSLCSIVALTNLSRKGIHLKLSNKKTILSYFKTVLTVANSITFIHESISFLNHCSTKVYLKLRWVCVTYRSQRYFYNFILWLSVLK